MSCFLLLLSFVLGVCFSIGEDSSLSGGALLCASFVLLYASFNKKWPFVLIGFALGLLLFFIPRGPFEGEVEGVGLVIHSKANYCIVLKGFKCYYVGIKNNDYQVFDLVYLKGVGKRTFFTNYENRFDFNVYLARLGCKTELTLKQHELRLGLPIRFHAWENQFLSNLNQDSKGFYASLLFNRKDEASSYLDIGSELGVVHLLSASGILFSLLVRFWKRILRPLSLSINVDVASAIFCLVFLPLGFQKVGILRLIFLECAKAILSIKKKQVDGLTLSSLVGLGMLAINPYYALQVGFLLPFGISSFLWFSSDVTLPFKSIYKKAVTMLLVYIFLFPALASFGDIHLFSPIYCLILTPFLFLCFLLGYAGFIFMPIKGLLEGLASASTGMMNLLSKADLSFKIPIDNLFIICSYYLLLYIVLYFFELGDFRRSFQFSFIPISCYALSFLPVQYVCTQQISFINVGQGDAILCRDHDKVVLLDTGGLSSFDTGEEIIVPYLKKQRIYHIDAIIASHHDHDHIGGVPYLQSHFNVKGYYDEASMFPLQIGSMVFNNLNTFSWTEENDKSLAFLLDFMGKKWMLTGDAPMAVEKKILETYDDLDCDILKVGHHGSSTSTSDAWLDETKPEVAIISCGRNNKYKHPNEDVLERLNKRHISIRRTDLEGTISYTQFDWFSLK